MEPPHLERTRTLVHDAAQRYDAGDPDAATAIMAAKVEASDAAVTMANEALTLCGGIAYREDARLHRILRDSRAAHVMSPTSELLRLWMGRTLLGQPLLGE